MSKFKIGDEVRCIGKPVIGLNYISAGGGWKKGLVFKITHIFNPFSDTNIFIYWSGNNGAGVYESYLELVKKINHLKNHQVLNINIEELYNKVNEIIDYLNKEK